MCLLAFKEFFTKLVTSVSPKFLLRKELDGRPLKSSQDEIYEEWQKRGLSRGKLRKHFLKIMEWDSVPELEVIEIYNKLKEKAYEIKHSENI